MILEKEIEAKLLDYFLGILDSNEEKEILRQVDSDQQFRETFYQFRTDFLNARWGTRVKMVQGNVAQIKRLLRRRRFVRWGSRIAAMFVVLLSIGIGVWKMSPESSHIPPEKEVITPGKSQAVLYLSSGESVALTKERKEILEDNGAIVMQNDTGEIRYNVNKKVVGPSSLFHRLVVPRGGEFMVTLEDGTKVWLNSGSELQYPLNFNEGKRIVRLKGEAYFEVTKISNSSFTVEVDQVSVNVLGTKFNINTQLNKMIQTVLVEGSVAIEDGDKQVILTPNQKVDYNLVDRIFSIEQVDAAIYVAWKDGNFVFDNESVESIMTRLSLWYDVNIIYENDELKKVKLSGDMKRYKDIRELLYFFERISEMRFVINGRNVIVSK